MAAARGRTGPGVEALAQSPPQEEREQDEGAEPVRHGRGGARARDPPGGQAQPAEDQAVVEHGVDHVDEDRHVQGGARVSDAAEERGEDHPDREGHLPRQARPQVALRRALERLRRPEQREHRLDPRRCEQHGEQCRRHDRVEAVPRPRAAAPWLPGPVVLGDEGLHAARRAVEEREDGPQPDRAEADGGELCRPEAPDHGGVDHAHEGGAELGENDRVGEVDHLAQPARARWRHRHGGTLGGDRHVNITRPRRRQPGFPESDCGEPPVR